MQEFVDIIVAQASIWVPAVTAIAGIIITVVKAIRAVRSHIETMKEDTTLKSVKDNTAQIVAQNQELIRCNKLLLDQLTRIHGYADAKAKETKK